MNCYSRYQRTSSGRDLHKTILIVSEGERTEPYYFQAFAYNSDKYHLVVKGTGFSTVGLVKEAIRLIKEAKRLRQKYDQVWCVFDKDEFSDGDFNEAVSLAKRCGIKCAYSNESFELWFVLHFEYCESALTRGVYCVKLGELLSSHGKYSKNKDDMYEILKDKQDIAIRNAKRLADNYDEGVTPSNQNPYTSVYKLVEALNELK